MSFRTPFWHFFANFLFHFVFFYPQIFYQNQGVSLIAHNGFFWGSFFCSLLPPWKFRFLFLAFFVDFMGFFLVSFWFLFFFSNKKTSPRVLSLDKVSIAFWVPFFCFSSVFLWSSSLPFYPLLPKLIRKIMPKESAEKHAHYSNSTITNQFCLEIIGCRVCFSFDSLIYPYYPAYMG